VDGLLEAVVEFCKEHDRWVIAFAAVALGWVLHKVLPAVGALVSRPLGWIRRRAGGRFARGLVERAYLNWVVLENQDLNLTGMIGSGEKPKLEQIFVAAGLERRGVVEPGTPQHAAEGSTKISIEQASLAEDIWPVLMRPLGRLFLRVSQLWIALRRDRPGRGASLFRPRRLWRMRLVLDRDEVLSAIETLALTAVFVLMPVYGLLLAPHGQGLPGAIGAATWSTLTGFSLLTVFVEGGRLARARKLLGIALSLAPAAAVVVVLAVRTLVRGESPLAMLIGVALGVSLTIIVAAWASNWVFRRGFLRRTEKQRRARKIGQLLSLHDNVAVLGRPGSGKSTYVQFVALTFAQERAGERTLRRRGIVRERFGMRKWLLPVPIRLRDVSRYLKDSPPADEGSLLLEAFRQCVLPSDIGRDFVESYIPYMLAKGNCLFLLDGLDEVADQTEFKVVGREVRGLLSKYAGNKFVLTSRHAGWRGGLGSSFEEYEIVDLVDDQIDDFIGSWYRAIEDNRVAMSGVTESSVERRHRQLKAEGNADKLRNALSQVQSIRSLAVNPLLLSMVCFVHYHKTLPKERLKLYEDCSSLLLVQWDREKGLPVDDTNLSLSRKEEIMQEIAYALHAGKIGGAHGRKEARGAEIVPIVGRMLEGFDMDANQADLLFQKLIDRSGIMVVAEKYSDRYAFNHLTFQEFYAAKYLDEKGLDLFEAVGDSSEHPSDGLTGWWREVALLYSALQKDPTRIIARLFRADDEDPLRQRLQIAAQCLAEAVIVPDQPTRHSLLAEILRVRCSGRDCTVPARYRAEIGQYLVRLATSSLFHRYAIIAALRGDHDRAGLPIALHSLLASANREVRLACLEALELVAREEGLAHELDPSTMLDLLSTGDVEVALSAMRLITANERGYMDQELGNAVAEVSRAVITRFSWDITIDCTDAQTLGEALGQAVKTLPRSAIDQLTTDLASILGSRVADPEPLVSRVLPDRPTDAACDIDTSSWLAALLMDLATPSRAAAYRRALLEAAHKGTPSQQCAALMALAHCLPSDAHVAERVVLALASPFRRVRRGAILALPRLALSGPLLTAATESLRAGLEPPSEWARLGARLRAGLSEHEAVLAAGCILVLDESAPSSLIDTFLAIVDRRPPSEAWGLLSTLPHGVIGRFNAGHAAWILDKYERDGMRSRERLPWPDLSAIITLGRLAQWSVGEVNDMICPLLFEALSSAREVYAFVAVRALRDVRATVEPDSGEHRALLTTLGSRDLACADAAFDILLDNQLL